MANIIVTGASGFIGEKLVSELLSRGNKVFAISTSFNQQNHNKNLVNLSCNLLDDNCVSLIIDKVSKNKIQFFYHLAWVGVHNKSNDYFEVNYKIAERCIELVSKLKCQYFIYSGSVYEYIKNLEYCCKSEGINYALSKKKIHRMLRENLASLNIKLLSLYISNIYGIRNNNIIYEIVFKMINKKEISLLTNGEQYCDFIYIDDVIRALIYIIENSSRLCSLMKNIEIYIGNGIIVPLKEYILKVEETLNIKYDILYGKNSMDEVDYSLVVYKNLNQISNFKYNTEFCEGVQRVKEGLNNE